MTHEEYNADDKKTISDAAEARRGQWLARLSGDSCDELQLALDDAVLDLCANSILGDLNATDEDNQQECIIAGGEEKASKINNLGPERQIDFILGECGEIEGVRILDELFSAKQNGLKPHD